MALSHFPHSAQRSAYFAYQPDATLIFHHTPAAGQPPVATLQQRRKPFNSDSCITNFMDLDGPAEAGSVR